MNIPFSLPVIDSDVIAEMNDTLTNTGWLTSGPKVVALENEFKKLTTAEAVVADAAHSVGASYKGKPIGTVADVTIFSLHSVKNITTGEGGAICLNLPEPFSHPEEYKFLKALSINGQTKSAFEKNQAGGWRYDMYLLRIKDITEDQRDAIIQQISLKGVGVNVHYIPMPMLTLFKNLGYKIEDYPNTYKLYANEISLPIYNGLTKEQLTRVVEAVVDAYDSVIKPK